jgi:hypothetical protein
MVRYEALPPWDWRISSRRLRNGSGLNMTDSEEDNFMVRVAYSSWAGYAWKGELHEQKSRVIQHLREIIEDEVTDHNPHHMLERAFSLTAFCMRRLIECHLVTDLFCETQMQVVEIPRTTDQKRHEHFLRDTGGDFFSHFDMQQRCLAMRSPKYISDKFLHARIIAVLTGSPYLPNGLLVASDHQAKHSLFHMTANEFDNIVRAFLDDQISFEMDAIDIRTGEAEP